MEYILPSVLVSFVAGALFVFVVFVRKGSNGRPTTTKRLKRGHWYGISAITGPVTISIWDPDEGEAGIKNPTSVRLPLSDMVDLETKRSIKFTRKKVEGKWRTVVEKSCHDPEELNEAQAKVAA